MKALVGVIGGQVAMDQEQWLDEEFRLLGVTPHITHIKFLPESRYSVVTVASELPISYVDQERQFGAIIFDYQHEMKRRSDIGRYIVDAYAEYDCGVALCHWHDQFNRQRGRIIAKGRLLKVLRAERAGR